MDTKHTPRRDFKALEKRRLKAVGLFKRGYTRAKVARTLGVSHETARRWHAAWSKGGRQGLKAAGRAGRKPKLNKAEVRKFGKELLRGPEAHGYVTQLWTLKRMATLLKKLTGVSYHPNHMWRVLREVGWSCQRPERRARERNEAAIKRWTRQEWPDVKKKPKS